MCALYICWSINVSIVKTEMLGVSFNRILSFWFMLAVWTLQCCSLETQEASDDSKFKLEGRVTVSLTTDQDWMSTTRILLDGGQMLGFLK